MLMLLGKINDYVVSVKNGCSREERRNISNWMWNEIDVDEIFANRESFEWMAWSELNKAIWDMNIKEN